MTNACGLCADVLHQTSECTLTAKIEREARTSVWASRAAAAAAAAPLGVKR